MSLSLSHTVVTLSESEPSYTLGPKEGMMARGWLRLKLIMMRAAAGQ